jgi:hypothetical protein
MKIIVCCEGSTDVGVLTVLLKKCTSFNTLEIDCRTHSELRNITLLNSKLPKNIKKESNRINRVAFIRRLQHIANDSNSKNVAYHQDADGNYTVVYQGIHEDFNAVLPSTIKRLAIVPKEMIESWLLADENAYPSVPKNPKLPSKPEDLWGNKDDPNHPKKYLVRVFSQFYMSDNRDTYAQIIEKTNIETLKRRCKSFNQFYTDMQTFIAGENAS